MSLWKNSSGDLLMNGTGDIIECATCPCGGAPGCPSDCCHCCQTYTVTIAAGGTITGNSFTGYFLWTWPLTSGITVINNQLGGGQCSWGSADTPVTMSRSFGPTPTGPWTPIGNPVSAVSVFCSGGSWGVGITLIPYTNGTLAATTTSCPAGTYSDGSTISNGSPCTPVC